MALQELNAQNFDAEVLQSELPVLVDFWAPWCGPCKALTPTIEKIAAEYGEKVKFAKVNVDDAPEVASRYSIMSIPTLLLFHNGEVVQQLVGLVQKEKIIEKLKSYI
ncbi:MAG: thioredoxin [Candidatus Cloacimonetes bacterium HGW-Cloacimonetes-1]|jgi:thioredoxin 1|nr:MAG: thioredoxin [Candidatus Cloacimonetes bacterium HGW-Cloacimonetes-1]